MSRFIEKSKAHFGMVFMSIMFVIFVIMLIISQGTYAGSEIDPTSQGHLVTIHDGERSTTVLSQATTIGDVVREAGFIVDKNDSVEPSVDTVMTESGYQVNIYRARPVLVIDGGSRTKIITPYQTSRQIVSSAGIKIYDEDALILERSSDILADGAGLKLIIKRAIPIQFTLFGKTNTVRTQAGNVAEMLKEKGIEMTENDHLSVDVNARITKDMKIRLWREGHQTLTVEKSINYDTRTIEDADKPFGYRVVQTAGVKGKRSVTYDILIRDGVEVKRTEIASLTITKSTTEVIVVGIKVTSSSDARAIGYNMMIKSGFNANQWTCLDKLWTRESQWKVTAKNPSSGAYGIPQSLPASKMASVGSDYLTNPETQIKWGLNYIKARYGTPCGAWQHSEDYGWY